MKKFHILGEKGKERFDEAQTISTIGHKRSALL